MRTVRQSPPVLVAVLLSILVFLVVLPPAQAQSDEVRAEMAAFELKWQEAAGNAEKALVAQETILATTRMDVKRSVQDMWNDIDPQGAKDWFEAQMKENETAANVYLYGRLVEDPAGQVEYARRAIELEPMFIYGYRLLTVPYMNNLFNGAADNPHRDKLAGTFERDYALLESGSQQMPDNAEMLNFLFSAQGFKKDYQGQLATLEKAEKLNAKWAHPGAFASVYVRLGEYDKAEDVLNHYLDESVAAGDLEPEDRDAVFYDRVSSALIGAEAWKEAEKYLKSVDDPDLKAFAMVDLARVFSAQGETKKARAALDKAVKAGLDTRGEIYRAGELAELRESEDFNKIEEGIEKNRMASEPKRRAEALEKRLDLAAPELTMTDSEGKVITLADLRGKIVVIDFWATWCGPCRMAMPEINQFTRAFAGDQVEVISLNVWENAPEKAKEYMRENDYAMRLLWPGEGMNATELFKVEGIPTLVVIDQDGVIRYRELGYEEGLEEKLGWYTKALLEGNRAG